jgi:hypothetical protein
VKSDKDSWVPPPEDHQGRTAFRLGGWAFAIILGVGSLVAVLVIVVMSY